MPLAMFGGPNRWTSSGPAGALVAQIVIDPTDSSAAYAFTPGAGIFKTSSAGESWRAINDGLPIANISAIFVMPDDPKTLYASARHEIFISTDAAEHWSLRGNLPGRVTTFAYDAASRTLYAGNNSGVYHSVDSGKTWDQRPDYRLGHSIIISLAVAPNGSVYALRATFPPRPADMLFRSDDHGDTWTNIPSSPAIYNLVIGRESSTIYTAAASNVFASADGGKTWSTLPQIVPRGFDVNVNSVLPVGADRIYAATNQGLYEYSGETAAWSAVASSLLDADIRFVAASASTPRRLYAAKTVGVVTGVEDGGDWTSADAGLPGPSATDVAIAASVPEVGYAATSVGVFKTQDNGESWQRVLANPTTRVAVSATAADTVYVTPPGITRTTDGGATWKTVKPDSATVLAVAPSDSATVYASLSSGMSRSANGGDSWMSAGSGLPLLFGYYGEIEFFSWSIAVNPSDASAVYVAEPSGIYKTVNGGERWTEAADIGANALAIDPSDGSIVYAATPSALFKSTNGGATWVKGWAPGEAILSLAIDPANPSVIYAGTRSAVFRSLDGGADWSLFDSGLPHVPVVQLAVSPSGNDLFAATTSGSFTYQVRDESYLQGAVKYQISLRTSSLNFVSAKNCGGSYVDANLRFVGPCDTFTLYDVNGEALTSGDTVYLQAANGSFLSAENGGSIGCGGCESPVNANRPVAALWETFTIHKTSGGQIFDGDAVTLQSTDGDYVAAEQGGANGCRCDSRLHANRMVAAVWETFVISIR